MVLYVHLSDAALADGRLGDLGRLGRLENTRSLVTVEQVRAWCGTPDTSVIVKPVIDLNDHVRVDAYEVPDRMHEAAVLVDHTCVFPWCTRPARGCRPDERDADCDHITPYAPDSSAGSTCSCNIAPLCRRHHRLKTHGGWRYTQVERGTYLWASPHGLSYLRDHEGTLDVTRDTPSRPCAHPPDHYLPAPHPATHRRGHRHARGRGHRGFETLAALAPQPPASRWSRCEERQDLPAGRGVRSVSDEPRDPARRRRRRLTGFRDARWRSLLNQRRPAGRGVRSVSDEPRDPATTPPRSGHRVSRRSLALAPQPAASRWSRCEERQRRASRPRR